MYLHTKLRILQKPVIRLTSQVIFRSLLTKFSVTETNSWTSYAKMYTCAINIDNSGVRMVPLVNNIKVLR